MEVKLKDILQELIDKDVSLEKCANILWQWKIYEAAKEEERDGIERDAGPDAQAHLHRVSESHRLQLQHYMVEADLNQQLINGLTRGIEN